MKSKVLSIEQMQELIKLGIDISKASLFWVESFYFDEKNNYKRIITQSVSLTPTTNAIPTFTLQDILEMLPKNITVDCGIFKQVKFPLQIHYGLLEYSIPKLGLCTEIIPKKGTSPLLQAAFNMLKWCKQNNFI